MPSAGFHFPFYGGGGPVDVEGNYGGAATAERPIPYTVSLAGVEYPIELRGPDGRQLYTRRSLDRQRQGVVQSPQPDDSQFNNEGAWYRYVTSWHLGAGQAQQDFGDDVSPFRFIDSLGVDVWDEFAATLLPSTSLLRAAAGSNQFLVATGVYVYHSDGATVYYSSDLSSWTACTGLTGTVQAMTTDGSTVYIATSTHIYTRADSAGGAAVATFTDDTDDWDNVAFVGNRLLASVGPILYELDSGGARTAFETHFQTAFRWTTIFSIGSRIYLGGYAGNRSELYTAAVDSSGTLVRSAEAAPFPFGEQLNSAVSYGGQAVLCTSLGVRLAALSGDGALSYGPLIDAPGNVLAASAEGRFVWFGWESITSGASGVGRLALDTAVRPLQPAYARDVYSTADNEAVLGVARFAGRTLFTIDGQGVFASSATSYVTSGYVESGQVFLGTIEPKKLTSLVVRTDQLSSLTSVSAEVTDERADSLGTFSVTGAGIYGLDASLIQSTDDGTEVQWAKVRITLIGNGTVTPTLRSWRMRGFPVIPITQEWIVPLIIHRHVVVNDAAGQLRSFDQLAQVERLVELVRNNAVVPYREGERTYRVRIDQFEWNPGEWDDSSDFFDGLMVVRLLSA
jgi:hypothetical protein